MEICKTLPWKKQQKVGEKKKKRTPKGHIVVYVGEAEEMVRFVVPISCLRNPEFQQLLEEAAQLYGFNYAHQGRITLPCSPTAFLAILNSSSAAG